MIMLIISVLQILNTKILKSRRDYIDTVSLYNNDNNLVLEPENSKFQIRPWERRKSKTDYNNKTYIN